MTNNIEKAEKWMHLMDDTFNIGPVSFGLDSLIGLIPGGGDAISILLSMYLVYIGLQMKLPAKKIARMILTIVIDFFIGLIPIFGDIGDVFYKANKKNLKLLKNSSIK